MRQPANLPRILSGRGQLFQEERPPIDVRYQILLAFTPALPAVPALPFTPAAPGGVPSVAPRVPAGTDNAIGHVVVLNRADLWRIDIAAEYQLALTNGRRCRVTLHHDPHQPFTKYRIWVPSQDLL